jgi:hypothetical protein
VSMRVLFSLAAIYAYLLCRRLGLRVDRGCSRGADVAVPDGVYSSTMLAEPARVSARARRCLRGRLHGRRGDASARSSRSPSSARSRLPPGSSTRSCRRRCSPPSSSPIGTHSPCPCARTWLALVLLVAFPVASARHTRLGSCVRASTRTRTARSTRRDPALDRSRGDAADLAGGWVIVPGASPGCCSRSSGRSVEPSSLCRARPSCSRRLLARSGADR